MSRRRAILAVILAKLLAGKPTGAPISIKLDDAPPALQPGAPSLRDKLRGTRLVPAGVVMLQSTLFLFKGDILSTVLRFERSDVRG